MRGEYEGAHLLDIAPTLLDLAGEDIPSAMQGRSLLKKPSTSAPLSTAQNEEDQMILHDRLEGLGYI